ncbi:MAG: enoyl reductase-like protein [Candidatus Paceibacteria bacterium]|jgi:enoyl reductase-like protein
MEDLNAQQIVLLTLLVSFVTSIATGIVTVSLLDQAPEPITQTINRIVERTIEKVITEPGEPGEKIIETVVVKEEDAIVEVVNSNSESIVRIYDIINEAKGNFIGLGVIVDGGGKVLASNKSIIEGTSYIGVYVGGEFNLSTETTDNTKIIYLNPSETGNTSFNDVTLSSNTAQLGQSIILLSGRETNKVTTGIVTELASIEDEAGESSVTGLVTSIDVENVLNGSIILNLKGEVVGLSLEGLNNFVLSQYIK